MTYLQKQGVEIKHGDYDFELITGRLYPNAETVSTGVFQWQNKSKGKQLKKLGAEVRVKGPISKASNINEMANQVRIDLQAGEWDGRKTVTIK